MVIFIVLCEGKCARNPDNDGLNLLQKIHFYVLKKVAQKPVHEIIHCIH